MNDACVHMFYVCIHTYFIYTHTYNELHAHLYIAVAVVIIIIIVFPVYVCMYVCMYVCVCVHVCDIYIYIFFKNTALPVGQDSTIDFSPRIPKIYGILESPRIPTLACHMRRL